MLAGVQDQFYPAPLAGNDGPLSLLLKLADLKRREARIAESFALAPKVDYIGAKAKIGSLNTQTLAEHIDDKFMTNPAGAAIVNTIGPIRQLVHGEDKIPRRYLVILPGTPDNHGVPVQVLSE